jgi:magnesium and cobalt transporter
MTPRVDMFCLPVSTSPEALRRKIIEQGYSRVPLYGTGPDDIVGILYARDLLGLMAEGKAPASAEPLLRKPYFVPEERSADQVLRDFQKRNTHVAIVVDEYGGVAGLITIEDVLEQIVGDIEDEFDFDEESDHIVAGEPGPHGPRYRVRAITGIEQFNRVFGTRFSDEEYDTIGGLVTDHFGRVPRRGDHVALEGIRFEVLRADGRQVQLLMAERVPPAPDSDDDRTVSG